MSKVQLSKYVNFIKRQEDTVVYHSQVGGACVVDNRILSILKLIGKIGSCELDELISKLEFSIQERELEEVIEEFTEKGFLRKDNLEVNYVAEYTDDRIKNLSTGKQIKTIQLVVSNNCNFNCKYCFEHSIYSSDERYLYQNDPNNKIMSPEDAIEYIRIVILTLNEQESNTLHIQFFGGEPLTNKETIVKVLEYFKDGASFNINISYSIVTNGSLIDANIASYFNKYNVGVIISFDNPNKSDRVMKSGKDSIQKTFDSLDILKAHDNYVAFNSVLSEHTFDYFDKSIIDCAIEYNVKEVGIVLDLNPEFYTKRSTSEICDRLMAVYNYGVKKGIEISGYWMSTYLAALDFKSMEKGFKTCSGTGSQFSIEPNGKVFACKGSSAYFGDIKDIKQLLQSRKYIEYSKRSISNSMNCETCCIEGFCSGFCLGPLEQQFGYVNHTVENYCSLIIEMTHRLFAVEKDLDYYEL